jgi:hypothetical protein
MYTTVNSSMESLTKWAFLALVLLVGGLLLYHLPPVDQVGQTPSSEMVAFELNRSVTELHRNLNHGFMVERRGDALGANSRSAAVKKYQLAVQYFQQAKKIMGGSRTSGYADRLVVRSLARLQAKIENYRTDDETI